MDRAGITQGPDHPSPSSSSNYYEIRVQGQLDSSWSDWFNNGLKVIPQENGETLIAGLMRDQAALQGILTKIFNLRLTLLSLKRVNPEAG
jgi:hypothetical protein